MDLFDPVCNPVHALTLRYRAGKRFGIRSIYVWLRDRLRLLPSWIPSGAPKIPKGHRE